MKRLILAAALWFALAVPAHAQTPGNRKVTLSWTPVATATGYNVYKNLTGGCGGSPTFMKITATPITATTFSESGLADGVTRCYYVTAVNAAGESTPSGTVQITTPIYTAPLAAVITPPISLGTGVE